VELWEAPIWDSARKHGISDEAMRHALRNNVRAMPDREDDSIMLFLGPDSAGNFIEIGVLDLGDGFAVIHAMSARWRRFFPEEGD
jgi:hypothetical protein